MVPDAIPSSTREPVAGIETNPTISCTKCTVKEISEPARVTPVVAETDVLVVGSGPGGLAAAISAARAGVETMIVERYGCFGGNLTHVGVEGIAWYRQKGTVDVEGIGIE